MNPISRRKLIYGGVASAVSIGGRAPGNALRTDSAGWRRNLRTRRDIDVRLPAAADLAHTGTRISAQHDLEEPICE